MATSSHVRRVATGGLALLALLLTGATWTRVLVTSTLSITVSVATVLLCAAGQLVTALRVQPTNNRCKIYDSEVN